MATEDKKVEEVKAPALKKESLRATRGDIVHPWTDKRFTTTEAKIHEVDAWVKIQKDAGLLVEEKAD